MGALAIFAAAHAPVCGAPIFVAPGESVQAAIDRAEVGGEVVLRPGLHRGPLSLTRSIVLRAESRDDGAEAVLFHEGWSPAIRVEVPTVARISGLSIRWGVGSWHPSPNPSAAEHSPLAIWILGGRVVLEDCDLGPSEPTDNRYWATKIASRALIADGGSVEIRNFRLDGFLDGFLFSDGARANIDGLLVSNLWGTGVEANEDAVLDARNCVFFRCADPAFLVHGATIRASGCLFFEAGHAAIRLVGFARGEIADSVFLRCGHAFVAETASDVFFHHNLVLGSRGAGGVLRDSAMRVEWNLFGEGGSGLAVEDELPFEDSEWFDDWRGPPMPRDAPAALPRAAVSDNVFWGHAPGRDIVGFEAIGKRAASGSIYADPNLADPASGDFRALAYEERRLEGSDRVPGPREPERLKPLFDAAKLFSTSPLPAEGDPGL